MEQNMLPHLRGNMPSFIKNFWNRSPENPIQWIANHAEQYCCVATSEVKAYCLFCFQEVYSFNLLKRMVQKQSPLLIKQENAGEILYPEQFSCFRCQKHFAGLPEILFRCARCGRGTQNYLTIEGKSEVFGSLSFITLCKMCASQGK